MATVTLGNIKLNWKGAYNAGTAYAIDDVVSYNGSSYIAKTATTGNLPTVTANWDLMSQAGTNGTNGTDLTTTLTTQGDILYRDGSGLARLGAGTSGQVLQTGGTGANPSWTTVSSDMVKLASYDITSSTSTFDFVNFTNDIYAYYRIQFSSVKFADNSARPLIRLINSSGSVKSDSAYTWLNLHPYSSGSNNYNLHGSYSDDKIDPFDNSIGTNYSQIGYIEFGHEDLISATQKPFIFHGTSRESGGQVNIHLGGGQYRNEVACGGTSGGFRVYSSSGNYVNGQITLYGFKK